jgi:hypothetical protein
MSLLHFLNKTISISTRGLEGEFGALWSRPKVAPIFLLGYWLCMAFAQIDASRDSGLRDIVNATNPNSDPSDRARHPHPQELFN